MRKLLLIAGVALLAAPSVALAQTGCFQPRHDSRVAGAGAGAVLAPASAQPHDRVVIGAVGGAAIDTVSTGGTSPCSGFTRVGYYDDLGVYHAGPGYYDSNGDWQSVGGYYDSDGDWVDSPAPPPASTTVSPPAATEFGSDVAYTGPEAAPKER